MELEEILLPEKYLIDPPVTKFTNPEKLETVSEMDYLEKAMRNDDLLANNGMKG